MMKTADTTNISEEHFPINRIRTTRSKWIPIYSLLSIIVIFSVDGTIPPNIILTTPPPVRQLVIVGRDGGPRMFVNLTDAEKQLYFSVGVSGGAGAAHNFHPDPSAGGRTFLQFLGGRNSHQRRNNNKQKQKPLFSFAEEQLTNLQQERPPASSSSKETITSGNSTDSRSTSAEGGSLTKGSSDDLLAEVFKTSSTADSIAIPPEKPTVSEKAGSASTVVTSERNELTPKSVIHDFLVTNSSTTQASSLHENNDDLKSISDPTQTQLNHDFPSLQQTLVNNRQPNDRAELPNDRHEPAAGNDSSTTSLSESFVGHLAKLEYTKSPQLKELEYMVREFNSDLKDVSLDDIGKYQAVVKHLTECQRQIGHRESCFTRVWFPIGSSLVLLASNVVLLCLFIRERRIRRVCMTCALSYSKTSSAPSTLSSASFSSTSSTYFSIK